MRIATRLFVRNIWLQAVLMAFAATFFAALIWSPAPATYTALEWAPYDTWMRLRSQPVLYSPLLLVVRDQASERQWGAGYWDRSLSARLITALYDAGAAAVGVDIPLDLPSPPNLGGAVSDALLIEAVKSAKTVAYPALPLSPLGEDVGLPSAFPDPCHGRKKYDPTAPGERPHGTPCAALSGRKLWRAPGLRLHIGDHLLECVSRSSRTATRTGDLAN